jgi:predicted phosphodiesterase
MNRSQWRITRRDFLKVGAGIGGALLGGCAVTRRLSRALSGKRLRFGMITDLHYADIAPRGSRHYRQSQGKLAECLDLMKQEQVDFLIELGDFKDQATPPEHDGTLGYLKTIEAQFQGFEGPTYHVLGNHDMDSISKQDFLSQVTNTGIAPDASYYAFDAQGLHCIVLDANFMANGQAYDSGNFDWTKTYICPEEMAWLERDLGRTRKKVLVFCHQCLDGTESHHVKNCAEVRQVLEDSKKVLAVFTGHNHAGDYSLINGIHYYTLKAVIEGKQATDNAYAIVEMHPNDTISVTGYRKAVSTEMAAVAVPFKSPQMTK